MLAGKGLICYAFSRGALHHCIRKTLALLKFEMILAIKKASDR